MLILRRRLPSVLAALVLTTVAGCTSGGPPTTTPPVTTGPSSARPSSAQPATTPRLRNPHNCPDAAGFTCSTLRVPLDPAGRSAGVLDLAVAAADNTNAPRGVLLFLTGGPGQPGVPFVSRLASTLAPVLHDYRLVLLDQRGTGADALVCTALQRQLGDSDLFVPTAAAVRDCAAAIGDKARFFGTEYTVADLDRLRRALGARTWTIDGVSYGTYVAERYALRYPDRVARLVLDSVVPQDNIGPFDTVPMHAAARVLRDVCAHRHCPGDPARDLATVIRHRQDGSDILNALTIEEFADPDYGRVPEILHAAAHGDMSGLDALLHGLRQAVRVPASELSQGLHASALCADIRWPWGRATGLAARQGALRRATARLDPKRIWPFDVATATGNGILQTCLRWPATPARRNAHRKLPDVPTLLLGGGHDLSTPIEWLRREARHSPDPTVVIVPGAAHSVQSRASDDRGRKAVFRFLTG